MHRDSSARVGLRCSSASSGSSPTIRVLRAVRGVGGRRARRRGTSSRGVRQSRQPAPRPGSRVCHRPVDGGREPVGERWETRVVGIPVDRLPERPVQVDDLGGPRSASAYRPSTRASAQVSARRPGSSRRVRPRSSVPRGRARGGGSGTRPLLVATRGCRRRRAEHGQGLGFRRS